MTVDEQFAQAVRAHRAGRIDEAAAGYSQVLAVNPNHSDALCNLAGITLDGGNAPAALEICQRSIAANPRSDDAYCTLANILNALNRPADAIAACRHALTFAPNNADILNNLGNSLNALGRLEEALAVYRRALQIRPNFVVTLSNSGAILARLGRLEDAVSVLRQCLAVRPNHAPAAANLAAALNELARPDEAFVAARAAVSINPRDGNAHNSLGNSLKDTARILESIVAYKTAAELIPSDPNLLGNLVYALEFCPGITPPDLLRAQRRWNDLYAVPLAPHVKLHANDRDPTRRLKVGYVSPNFFAHAESFFTVPLFEHHDRNQFEIHCYAAVLNPDGITQRTRAAVDQWHDTLPLGDLELAEKIRADGIDILIDLTMHMGKTRLQTFALKPAPIQICWLAYPGGTGLDAMDYRITDPFLDPPSMPMDHYREKSIRLPDSWVCFDPLSDAAPAAARSDLIRFGSFNNPCKINDPLVQLWAKVLAAIPDSSAVIQITSKEHQNRIRAIFQNGGVAPGRVEFVGRVLRNEYLRLYDQIDICLDPLPYNGITTTCDALWMGVPVVTLQGKTAAGRAGAGILSAVGLTDLITGTEEEFVATASRLTVDRPRLAELRTTLRGKLTSSPVMDAPGFARKMESAFRAAWLAWCKG